MTDDMVGYGRPPTKSQFKPGVSGNPKGRPKRDPAAISNIIKTALNAPIQYRERGRTKTATRTEIGLRKLVENALNGDLTAAATLLEYRIQASRNGDIGVETVEVTGGLPRTHTQQSQKSASVGQSSSQRPDQP
jgi:Family of unknown function (DUF5681)